MSRLAKTFYQPLAIGKGSKTRRNMDRVELNKKVYLLLDRASNLQPSLELRAEINHDCTLLRTAIKQLHENLDHSELPSLPGEETTVGIYEQLRRLKAELAVWKDMEPEVPHIGKESLKSVEWLEQLKECSRAVSTEKTTVKAKIEREVKHLEEVKEIKQALQEKVDTKQQQVKGNGRSETEDSKHIEQCEHFKSKMKWFIENYLPEPNSNQRKRKSEHALDKKLPERERAVEFIQNLVAKLLDHPDDPYLNSSDLPEDWYLLLLRSGVIQPHPTENTLVQLTPFHH